MDFNPEIDFIESDQTELIRRGLKYSTRGGVKTVTIPCCVNCAICNV